MSQGINCTKNKLKNWMKSNVPRKSLIVCSRCNPSLGIYLLWWYGREKVEDIKTKKKKYELLHQNNNKYYKRFFTLYSCFFYICLLYITYYTDIFYVTAILCTFRNGVFLFDKPLNMFWSNNKKILQFENRLKNKRKQQKTERKRLNFS